MYQIAILLAPVVILAHAKYHKTVLFIPNAKTNAHCPMAVFHITLLAPRPTTISSTSIPPFLISNLVGAGTVIPVPIITVAPLLSYICELIIPVPLVEYLGTKCSIPTSEPVKPLVVEELVRIHKSIPVLVNHRTTSFGFAQPLL